MVKTENKKTAIETFHLASGDVLVYINDKLMYKGIHDPDSADYADFMEEAHLKPIHAELVERWQSDLSANVTERSSLDELRRTHQVGRPAKLIQGV